MLYALTVSERQISTIFEVNYASNVTARVCMYKEYWMDSTLVRVPLHNEGSQFEHKH